MANYYLKSFVWSTLSRIITAVVGFVSVPLLLGLYGKADYGILSIATACNAYMHLLDLGMNSGAVKYFSQWKASGQTQLVYSVARTNITFYIIISLINMAGLIALALWGEPFFSVTHEQFLTLRTCLFILAAFSSLSWIAAAFDQLLVADKQISFTMMMQTLQGILKGCLVAAVIFFKAQLVTYFLCLTAILSLLIFPYAYKCRKDGLIDSLMPKTDWKSFKVVLIFSLSLFALSVFQTTASQSRPILLSIFAVNGAETVAEFRIIEVVPQLIIMIGGVFSSIFLPKTSEMVVKSNREELSVFAYKWTTLTTIIANILCLPFIIGANEVLTAYVGSEYAFLSECMIIWVVCVLCQIHSTPTNALILAYGKTRILVICTAVACLVSMIVNISLAHSIGVKSAVIGYSIYIAGLLLCNYLYYYRRMLHLSVRKIAFSFLAPTFLGACSLAVTILLFNYAISHEPGEDRLGNILSFAAKTIVWITIYASLLLLTRTVKIEKRRILTRYDDKPVTQ